MKRIIVTYVKRIIVIKGGRWQLGGLNECKWKRHGRGAIAPYMVAGLSGEYRLVSAVLHVGTSTSWVRLGCGGGIVSEAAYDKLLIKINYPQ